MMIAGLQKTTLLDYPGHLAATIFLSGCNFRCPFCHNSDLVLHASDIPDISTEVFSYLEKRRNILEGVCITGGEPTLWSELPKLITSIRALGLKIKLDTNGYHPEVLSDLLRHNLLDYVAMDIKTSFDDYALVCGVPNIDTSPIKSSARLLMESGIPFEFRTTLVKELHNAISIEEIAHRLAGEEAYYLQNYKSTKNCINPEFTPFTKEELEHFQEIMKPFLPNVSIRGVD